MKVKDIVKKIEDFAPLSLSREFCALEGCHDNSGLLIGGKDREVTKIMVTVDLTLKALEKALAEKADFVFTHHPLIYNPILKIVKDDVLGLKILTLIENKIALYSGHLSFDAALGGVDDSILSCFGATSVHTFLKVGNGGYGKVANVEMSLSQLVAALQKMEVLKISQPKKLERIASFCGGGLSEDYIAKCKGMDVDLVITSDVPNHLQKSLEDLGIGLILLSHDKMELEGLKIAVQKINFGVESFFFED